MNNIAEIIAHFQENIIQNMTTVNNKEIGYIINVTRRRTVLQKALSLNFEQSHMENKLIGAVTTDEKIK